MSNSVHIVVGVTGEFDERVEWTEGAYITEANAAERVRELETLLRECGGLAEGPHAIFLSEQVIARFRGDPKGDPKGRIDYTGTSYSYYTVELKDGART